MQTEPTAYNHSHILHQVIARSCVKACTSAVAWVRPCYETFVAVKQRRMGCKSRPQLMEETWQRNASDGEPSYVFAWTTAFFQPRVALPCQESVIEVKHARCGANRIYEFDHSHVPHRQIRCSVMCMNASSCREFRGASVRKIKCGKLYRNRSYTFHVF